MNNNFFSLLTLFLFLGLAQPKRADTNIDFVPDKETAIKIAEAIWFPIYGTKIYDSRPFVAKLKDNKIWIVEGTLKKEYNVGGVPYIEIQKKDCKVLKVTHGK